MLKSIRVILAVLSILALTFMFVDFTGWAVQWFDWLPKLQLIPAILAVNLIAVAILAMLTYLFGRIYCSVICPLGIFKDIIIRIRNLFTPKRKRRAGQFRYTPANTKLRLGFFAFFVVLLVLGLVGIIATSIAGILDPYSAYGRMVGQFIVPGWRAGVDAAAEHAAAGGTYILAGAPPVAAWSLPVAIVAAVTLLVVVIFATRTGRGYCNNVCPVGTLLGFLSRYSFFKVTIDTDKCNRCGSCGRHCKSQCIDTKNHRIDYSRCVACMDCIGSCSQGAIRFRRAPGRCSGVKAVAQAETAPDTSRRAFLTGVAIAGAAIAAQAADKTTDGGLAPLKQKQPHRKSQAPVPPGAISLKHLASHCTACQLCISQCPNGVLKPSTKFESFMQPTMEFTSGFCRPECTRCSEVCPAGAIIPITPEEKSSIKIGTAKVNLKTCISAAFGQHCGNCERHCPTEAVKMVEVDGRLRPVVDESRCIGCGDCEFHCPSGTAGQLSAKTAAIYVVACDVHQKI